MAAIEPLLYFANPSTLAVRLHLNTDTTWALAEGLDLGGKDLVEFTLGNETEDGEEVVSSKRPRSTMTLPVFLREQANFAAIKTAMDALETELDRDTNAIVYQPKDTSLLYVYDTFRAPIPSLFRGQALLTDCLKGDSAVMPLVLRRMPHARNAGTHI